MGTDGASREGLFVVGTFELNDTHPPRKQVGCEPVRDVIAGSLNPSNLFPVIARGRILAGKCWLVW